MKIQDDSGKIKCISIYYEAQLIHKFSFLLKNEYFNDMDIELALKLTGFLKYDLFGEVNSEEEPSITITYFLKDGTSKTISANNTTVWWNNKIHVIKDKEMFINLTEGIFFLEDLQTK